VYSTQGTGWVPGPSGMPGEARGVWDEVPALQGYASAAEKGHIAECKILHREAWEVLQSLRELGEGCPESG
jgi:hypothetical protein